MPRRSRAAPSGAVAPGRIRGPRRSRLAGSAPLARRGADHRSYWTDQVSAFHSGPDSVGLSSTPSIELWYAMNVGFW